MRFFTVTTAVLLVLAAAAPKVAFAPLSALSRLSLHSLTTNSFIPFPPADEAAVEELKVDEKSSVAGAAAQAALDEYNKEYKSDYYYNAGGRAVNIATPLTVVGALAALAGLALY
ncbi:hypothetical protein HK101_008472 [Irineochytrium annulatum]|nr:hypothetical protein HK101_008472 [Irineochytrium annulatum]